MVIGVLALQGGFKEHRQAIEECGADAVEVRKREQLEGIKGLIIPGGESTSIGKMLVEYNLFDEIKSRGKKGMPIFGTCAGMILMAKKVLDFAQPRLGVMDIEVKRNAYGRQIESFEEPIQIQVLGERPFTAVFIRAPQIIAYGPRVEILARNEGKVVCVREDHFLATNFHPELTKDRRLHKYFLSIVEKSVAQKNVL